MSGGTENPIELIQRGLTMLHGQNQERAKQAVQEIEHAQARIADTGAADHYDVISRAADPQAAIRKLSRQQLICLNDYTRSLPSTGMPGVVKAALTMECATRFLNAGGGQ